MDIDRKIPPYKSTFPEFLSNYCAEMRDYVKQNKHHDRRRHLFTNFMREAFEIDPKEVAIEEKVKVAQVRGYIDALYRYIIFEFKTNLESERDAARIELKKYFESQSDPTEYIALVSNGLEFEVYQYENRRVQFLYGFELNEDDSFSSYRFLDDILFASKKITPKSEDIVTRFGLNSAVFNKVRVPLQELFSRVRKATSVKTKYDEWNSLLAKVYGEQLGDPSLFIRHTYLTVLSRLMVAQALFPQGLRGKSDFKGLLTGRFFSKKNLPNLAEPDFFSWALDTEAEEDFIGLVARLDRHLAAFRLDNIGEDVLKEIYQELVDPKSRHSLGEYYTPDWIADLALARIKYRRGKLLDPACGSGTFLLATIRCLRRNGLVGRNLVETVSQNVLGIDVHPLAVIMTKANMLLGLAQDIRRVKTEVYLPVYMADTLLVQEERNSRTIRVPVSDEREFQIPLQTTERGSLVDTLVDKISQTCEGGFDSDSERRKAWRGLERTTFKNLDERELFFWRQNFNLYSKLVAEKRNSIWAFILKNAYRPAFIRQQKVDYVVGNPPWLAYRYVKDKTYKSRVKDLTLKLGLLEKGDVKLFTQMDTSTLFFVYCEKEFLKPDGTMAFVLPKTTVLPSKQHLNFQSLGVTEVHDFSEVSPLFNVRSVLILRNNKNHMTEDIPSFVYSGKLTFKNMPWDSAKKHLDVTEDKLNFLSAEKKSEYYYPRFLQGATIVPRCFWFIEPDKDAAEHEVTPYFKTSEEAYKDSKPAWEQKIDGRLEKQFLYETILAKDIVPFAILGTDLLFLPIQKRTDSISMADYPVLLDLGCENAARWFKKVETLWEKHRQSTDRSLIQWLNYNQKLINQNVDAEMVLLYNTSGTNLTASLYFPGKKRNLPYRPKGFIADAKTYYYYPASIEEGYYLAAVLNSDIVNEAIKEYQPQGLYGERDIHRRPFEVCNIPKFDSSNPLHTQLAQLGKLCREEIEPYCPQLKGRIGQLRLEVRRILKDKIVKINKLVESLLEGQGQRKVARKKTKNPESDLFE